MTKKLLEEKILYSASLEKCLKCRCFMETLDTINKQLRYLVDEDSLSILNTVERVEKQLLESQYT